MNWLTEAEFISACETIMAHDDRIYRINRFLAETACDNDGIFGGLPDVSTPLRRVAIGLLSVASGISPKNSNIEYFFDECLHMKDGGSITFPDGSHFKVRTVQDLWAVVEYERSLPSPSPVGGG